MFTYRPKTDIIYRGAYNSNTLYCKHDVVKYKNIFYIFVKNPRADHKYINMDVCISEGSAVEYSFANDIASSGGGECCISITYKDLVDLRNDNELVPGIWYRIIDYNTATIQTNTQSVSHRFDVIVLALSKNKLSENANAIMHDNIYDVTFSDNVTKKCYIYSVDNINYNIVDADTLLGISDVEVPAEVGVNETNKTAITPVYSSIELQIADLKYNYFQDCKLESWQIKYCLDNDTDRFAWADDNSIPQISQNGTWFNRDENEDFNNLYGWKDSQNSIVFTKSIFPKIGDDTYDDTGIEDSVITAVKGFGRGVIYQLVDEWGNECPYDFKNIQFRRKLTNGGLDAESGVDTWVYTFNVVPWNVDDDEYGGCEDASVIHNLYNDECYGECASNVIKPRYNSTASEDDGTDGQIELNNIVFLGRYNIENGTPQYMYSACSNTFGNDCYSNTFGNDCYGNTFGNDCSSIRFGNNCSSNTFGYNCYGNTFGNNCYSNTFGNNCSSIRFGNNCSSIRFGNNCYSNTFGNNCSSNTFGNNCSSIRFGKDYTQNVIIESGNRYITLTSTQTTSNSSRLRNIRISLGVNNTDRTKTITHPTVGDIFMTEYKSANSQTILI